MRRPSQGWPAPIGEITSQTLYNVKGILARGVWLGYNFLASGEVIMARKPRAGGPGAFHWVTGRCVEETRLKGSGRDLFLEVFRRTVGRHRWRCHAYAVLAEGYQLVLETPEPNLSRGMRDLIGEFTQTYNRCDNRTGPVFGGRFKSSLVEEGTPLMEVCRAVVLAPVAGGLCKKPGKWPWSSFAATAGLVARPDFLSVEWLLGQFGAKAKKSRPKYEKFVKLGVGGEPPAVRHGFVVGSEGFERQVLSGRLKSAKASSKRVSRTALKSLFPPEVIGNPTRRDALIYKARSVEGCTLSAIGLAVGLHPATISRITRAQEAEQGGWGDGGKKELASGRRGAAGEKGGVKSERKRKAGGR